MHLLLLQVVWARWWSHQGEQQVKKWKYFFIPSQNKELLYNLIYEGLKVVFCEITFLTLDFSKEKKSRVDILKYLDQINGSPLQQLPFGPCYQFI